TPSGSAANDFFGSSVAISGNLVLVGAYLNDTGAMNAGAAYLYDATSGNLLHTFTDPAVASNDQFGTSVAISGNNLLIGSPLYSTGTANRGIAYLFDAGTGNMLQMINNPFVSSD